jgi:uncharacterized membrane protein
MNVNITIVLIGCLLIFFGVVLMVVDKPNQEKIIEKVNDYKNCQDEYILIMDEDPNTFKVNVNAAIQAGYEPVGEIICVAINNLTQALRKKKLPVESPSR